MGGVRCLDRHAAICPDRRIPRAASLLSPQRCPFNRGNGCSPGIAWRCHRSILQPEERERARWSCTTACRGHGVRSLRSSSARGQVRQFLQDRLQRGITGCGGSRVLRRQLTDGRAQLLAARLGRCQCFPCSLGDQPTFLLGQPTRRARVRYVSFKRIDGLGALRSPPDRTNPRAREPPSGGFSASRPVPAEHCGL